MRGLANNLPEHAARIAAVLTLLHDVAGEVASAEIESGVAIAKHRAAEALRWLRSGVAPRLRAEPANL
jgi:hypothetical protein